MKNKIILFLGIMLLSFFGNNGVFSAENNINIQSKISNIIKIIEIQGDTIIVNGDINFPDNVKIPYNLHVKGNFSVGNNVELLGNIQVDGDIFFGNNVTIGKTIQGNNITAGTYLQAQKIIAKGNVEFHGFAKIIKGLEIGGNFESGSDMILQGYSKILGNVTLGKSVKISGIFYVYGNMRGNYDLLFQGDKLKVVGNFRTQKDSNLKGKLYMFAKNGHRVFYGNRSFRYRYKFKNTQYRGNMKEIDPLLYYNISQENIDIIFRNIRNYEKLISEQKRKIKKLYIFHSSEYIVNNEIQVLQNIQQNMFDFILPYIEKENWDFKQWKIFKIQEKIELKKFIYQYYSGSEFDY